MAMTIMSQTMNGKAAQHISLIAVSGGETPFITKRSMPKGGVMSPILPGFRMFLGSKMGLPRSLPYFARASSPKAYC
jgi:hypothetical protein